MHIVAKRYTETIEFCGPGSDLDLPPAKVEAYEARWREIKEAYKAVRLYLHTGVHSIGEVLYRYFAMCEEPREDGALYVQLSSDTWDRGGKIANAFANEYVGICPEEDIEFWAYVLKEHAGELNGDIRKFVSRNSFPAYFKKAYSIKPHFTDEQVERGEEALKAMGITGPFVCFVARTGRYYNIVGHGKDEAGYTSRNMDFRDYGKAIAWLGERGIQCVKMGRFEDPIDPIPNCIDYSAHHASDFMDLYAFSRCEFAVTCLSGPTTLANLFAKPLLMVNVTAFSLGLGAVRYTEYDRFLPKHFYVRDPQKRRIKRSLSLREMFETEKDLDFSDAHLVERGIEWSDDTEDEILDAVKEMVSRIEGTWADTEDDEELLDRWWALYDEMEAFQSANARNWVGGPVPFPPATTFLTAHPHLVD